MPTFSEETLDGWRKPASDNEEQKISNAISMIKDAINTHPVLKGKSIEFIIQGSYGNNTNVRQNSDIDVCVMLTDTFYSEYREGISDHHYGFVDGSNNFDDYRRYIIEAMNSKFGYENVTPGNKSIEIKSNTYRVQADVVPAFQYRNYSADFKNNPHNFVEGIKFYAADGKAVINYPKIHVKNGVDKNGNTLRRYKRTVRLYKRIRNSMIEEALLGTSGNIRSFLIEGLLWNVPNTTFSNTITWNELLKESIFYLYHATKNDEGCKEWGEVSERFYLFHSERSWNRAETNEFLVKMWNYLGYV